MILLSGLICGAMARERALGAFRRFRQADSRAEFHDGLVEIAGASAIDQLVRDGGETVAGSGRSDVAGIGSEAAEHAQRITINGGVRQSESDARHGCRGVIADSGEGSDGRVIVGERAALCNLDGSFPEIAGAGIISEAGPGRKYIVFPRCRQASQRLERAAGIVRNKAGRRRPAFAEA